MRINLGRLRLHFVMDSHYYMRINRTILNTACNKHIHRKKRFPESQGTENKNLYCHTKRVRKISRDKSSKQPPDSHFQRASNWVWNERNQTSRVLQRLTPMQNPSTSTHGSITGVSSVLWAGQTLPAAFYQWTTSSSTSWRGLDPKWCLKHQLPQLRSLHLWLRILGIGFLPRAALCTAKHVRVRKKNTTSPHPQKNPKNQKQPIQTKKSTLKLQSLDICKKMEGGSLLQGICLSTAARFTTVTLWTMLEYRDTALGRPNKKELRTFGKA